VEAANDAKTVLVDTPCGKKITARRIYQNWYSSIATYMTKSILIGRNQ